MITLHARPSTCTLAITALALFCTFTTVAALAQQPPPPPRHPPPPPREHLDPPPPADDEPLSRDERDPRSEPPPDVDEVGGESAGPATRPAGRPRRAEELAALLFRPRPQDLGPLQPGEEETLMQFARDRAPRVYRALEWFRDRRPMAFQQRLSGMAPRLRQLKRVYERSPALGDALRGHMESTFEIRRRMQILNENEPGSALRDRTVEELRDLVADSVEREHQALLLLADELDKRRDERVAAWVDYLTTTGDPDFPRLPEPARELVRRYRATSSEAERGSIREQMRERVEKFLTTETAALRERAELRQAETSNEVDRRLKALIEDSERRGPPPGPHPPRRGPRPLP